MPLFVVQFPLLFGLEFDKFGRFGIFDLIIPDYSIQLHRENITKLLLKFLPTILALVMIEYRTPAFLVSLIDHLLHPLFRQILRSLLSPLRLIRIVMRRLLGIIHILQVLNSPQLFRRKNCGACLQPLDETDIKDFPSKPGHIATRPILSQLGIILSGTVAFDKIQLHKYYNVAESTTSINAAILAEQIAATQTAAVSVSDPIILLISGKLTQKGERAVFGYYLTWFNSGDPDPCLLFQLSSVHDVFKGDNASRPGWKIDSDENLVFGERRNGVALVLEKDCKRAMISHHVSGKGMYNATAWRGDWQADVQVEEIEM